MKLTHYLYLSEGDVLGKIVRRCPIRVLHVDDRTINFAALKDALGDDHDADERGLVLIDSKPTHQWLWLRGMP